MKKLILFLFVIILSTGCETTDSLKKKKPVSVYEIIENRKIEKNFTKKELKNALGLKYMLNNPFTQAGSSHLILEENAEIISGGNQNIFYVFKNVSKPTKCGFFGCDYGNGTLESWHKSFDEAIYSLGQKEMTQKEKIKKTVSTTDTSKTKKTSKTSSSNYNSRKYVICYGQMTKAHKKRGFHQRNRLASIKVKETVCKAYAKGEINSYEGKGL